MHSESSAAAKAYRIRNKYSTNGYCPIDGRHKMDSNKGVMQSNRVNFQNGAALPFFQPRLPQYVAQTVMWEERQVDKQGKYHKS